MSKVVDVDKVQEALDRAARQAVQGSRDVRAGRLAAGEARASLPRGKPRLMSKPGSSNQSSATTVEIQIKVGRQIAERLRNEARWAQQAWALWEALNGGANDNRRELRGALQYLGLGQQAGFLQGVLARDALLALFRISDQENKERLTLCAIARLLQDDQLRTKLAAKDWLLANDYPDFIVAFEAREQPKRIEIIRNSVSPKWSAQAPKERVLFDLRSKLRDVRDKILAHPLDASGIDQPTVDEVREFLRVTTDLVGKTELVFLGAAQATTNQFDVCSREAAKLWDYFGEGPIQAHRHDVEMRRKAGIE